MILKNENGITRRKMCPSAAFSTINPSLTDLESNPGLRGERPTTKRLSLVQMFVLQASCFIPRQYKQVYYYLGRSWRCRFGDVCYLFALSVLANIRLTSTVVFLAVNSGLICDIRRDMK